MNVFNKKLNVCKRNIFGCFLIFYRSSAIYKDKCQCKKYCKFLLLNKLQKYFFNYLLVNKSLIILTFYGRVRNYPKGG